MRKEKKIGEWAFIIGIGFAIFCGVVIGRVEGRIATVLGLFGIMTGFFAIREREAKKFLIATIAFLLTGSAGLEELPLIGERIGPIFTNIATFVAPAAAIIALKVIYNLARK